MLPFGSRRQGLPPDAEALAYSYLTLADLAELFFASHGMATNITKNLGVMKTITYSEETFDDQLASPFDRLALTLAASHCRSLTHIRIDRSNDFEDNGAPNQRAFNVWLQKIISRCSASLRVVKYQSCDALSLKMIMNCPLLEEFEANHHSSDKKASKVVKDLLNARQLPHLRSLRLLTDRGNAAAQQARLCVILREPFALRKLSVWGMGKSALPLLASAHLSGLEDLRIGLVFDAETDDLLAKLEKAINGMTSLSTLKLESPSSFGIHDPPARKRSGVTFALPQLRILKLCGRFMLQIPTVVAPNLESISITECTRDLVKWVVFTCQDCASLREIKMVCHGDNDDFHAKTKLGVALAARKWPKLTKCCVEISGLFSPALLMCISRCSLNMRKVSWLTPMPVTAAELKDFLTQQTALQWLHIRVTDSSNPSDSDEGEGDAAEEDLAKRSKSTAVASEKKAKKEQKKDHKDKTEKNAAKEKKADRTTSAATKPSGVTVRADLQRLELYDVHVGPELFTNLSFPKLFELDLASNLVQLPSLERVLSCCPALAKLRLNYVSAASWSTGGLKLPSLTQLTIQYLPALAVSDTLVSLLSACPRLADLKMGCPEPFSRFVAFAESGNLKHLRRLSIHDHFKAVDDDIEYDGTAAKRAIATAAQVQALILALPALNYLVAFMDRHQLLSKADFTTARAWLKEANASGRVKHLRDIAGRSVQ